MRFSSTTRGSKQVKKTFFMVAEKNYLVAEAAVSIRLFLGETQENARMAFLF
jgi:hypothetical protein